MKKKFLAKISNGKMFLKDRVLFDAETKKLGDGDIIVVLEKATKGQVRSILENSYYWGVVLDTISSETGDDDVNFLHDFCKVKFLGPKVLGKPIDMEELDNEQIKKGAKVLTTTTLKTFEFEHYLSQIRIWASRDLSVFIPLPNEAEIKDLFPSND